MGIMVHFYFKVPPGKSFKSDEGSLWPIWSIVLPTLENELVLDLTQTKLTPCLINCLSMYN
jgi:hypothetical protein